MSLHRHYIFNPVLSHYPPLCPTLTMEVQAWRRILTMPNTAQEGSILTYAERQLHMDPSRPGSWGPSSLQAWTPPSSPLCTLAVAVKPLKLHVLQIWNRHNGVSTSCVLVRVRWHKAHKAIQCPTHSTQAMTGNYVCSKQNFSFQRWLYKITWQI